MPKDTDIAVCPACGKVLEEKTPYKDFFTHSVSADEETMSDFCDWCDSEYEFTRKGTEITAKRK